MTTTNTANKTKLNLRFSFTTAIVCLLCYYRNYSSFAATAAFLIYLGGYPYPYFPATLLLLIFDKKFFLLGKYNEVPILCQHFNSERCCAGFL